MRRSTVELMIAGVLAFSIAAAPMTAALAQDAPAATADTPKGKALVDRKGMTLYVYDRDTTDNSHCNGHCAVNWRPLAAATTAKAVGQWMVITRSDGRKQWAYKGKPVYRFAKDTKPRDVKGDGVNHAWHIARP